jgi:hypothetical protein
VTNARWRRSQRPDGRRVRAALSRWPTPTQVGNSRLPATVRHTDEIRGIPTLSTLALSCALDEGYGTTGTSPVAVNPLLARTPPQDLDQPSFYLPPRASNAAPGRYLPRSRRIPRRFETL